eukprot:TCALIF_00395-PA protein Name:"Protein of unknown function" AED:0.31 eAED:0.31 QI:0/0.5/0.33/0.66/0.5/1/3/0/111
MDRILDRAAMTFFTQSPSPNERDCLESHTLNLEEENILIGHQSYCPRHWDHLLCWPLGKSNATLGIPCNASRSFVEIVLSSRPTIHTEDIPGMEPPLLISNLFDIRSLNAR